MICVQSPLKREYIKELLDKKEFDSIVFHFVKQEQMKLFFTHTGESEKAVAVAKKVIKTSELGSALFFMVTHV